MTKYYISNCGHDEHGNCYKDGQAGDQTDPHDPDKTGGEWEIRTWYDRPWTDIYRHPSYNVRMHIAAWATMAAENDAVGYDQNQRETFWEQLKANSYRPDKIKKACETDCSAGVAAIVKAVGYYLGREPLQGVSSGMNTTTETTELPKAGFKHLTASKYTSKPNNLEPGDILRMDGHTAIYLGTDGKGVVLAYLKGTYELKYNSTMRKKAKAASKKVKTSEMTKTLAGKCNAKGNLKAGSKVSVSKTCIRKNGNYWGYTKSGWICLKSKRKGARVK